MNKRSFSRYIYAILAVPVIVLMRYALMPLIGPGVPYVTLFPVSVAVALLAGMGPAILTGILGSIAIDYLFIEPLHAIEFDVPGISRMAVVVLTSAFVGYVGDMLRAARAKAEQQAVDLRQSQNDMNRAQAVGNTGSWRMNVQQNELTWSDENHRIFGIPKGTRMTYETFLSTIHPDDKKYVDTNWKACLAGEPYDIEHRIIVDGQIKWVREKAFLEFDQKGGLLGGFGTTQDITERKRTDGALLASEARYRRLFEAARDGILILDADSGQIVDVNPFIEDILGYSHKEFLDKKLWEIGLFKNIAASKEAFMKLQTRGYVRYENLPLETKDGRHIAVEFVSNVYQVDHTKVIQCNIRDITDRAQAEEALRKAHDELDARVKERTADLDETVAELQKQVQQRIKAEEIVKAERKRFEDVLEMMPAYAILLTPDYHVAYANRTFREWFGNDNGKKCYEFLFNRTEPCENCQTYNVLKTGKSHLWEWTGPNGHNYDIYDYPFTDTDGSPLIMEIGVDVTTHKQTQKAVMLGEERYRSLTVATTQIVWTTDAQGQVIGDMPSWRAFTGQSVDEIQGWGWINSLHTDDREHTAKIWSQSVQNKSLYETEYRIRRHDGKYRYVSVRGVPVLEQGGSIREWVGTCTDITERKLAQEALRSASLYTRGLLEASLDPLVTISPEGKITDVNRATELVTGVQRQNLIGSDFSNYFTEPQKAKYGYKKVLAEGMVKDYPLTIRHISGHTTDVMYNATLYKNEAGQIQGVFATARDVTEHNRIEKRAQITNVLLELFAQKATRKDYLDSVVNAIRDWSGCQCIGIRLANSDGFIPYESQIGFTNEFLAVEGVLSLKTDTCACMRVITQTPEPQDAQVMTSKGSFRCDNTLEFFNALPEKKKVRYRGHCIRHGFASLAVVPIRYRDKVLGAIHLADKKENKTPAQAVEFIENMAMLIGEAVHRFDIETELRESEERYRQLVELSPEGIGVERDDKIVFINTAAVRLLGAKNSAELIGKSILDFVYPEHRKRTHMQLEFLRRKRKALPLRENIFIRVDGTTIDVEVAATPLFYENRLAAQIVFRDITERKLAHERIIANQKQLRLLTAELLLTEERERHEIATALHDSLGPILAFSKRELGILQKSAPPHIAETLKNVSDNISQAVKQTRTLTFDLSPPTLYTLGFEIAIEELLERFCQEHKLEYSFRNSDASKPLTDPVKVLLYRSVRETLINIAKHARAKLVKVVLSRADNDIEITIEDDGKGFDESMLSEKPKGLGLFSVRERLRHIGGKLEIISKRGKGTHITLTAPLKIG